MPRAEQTTTPDVEVVVLGTGTPVPDRDRAGAAVAIVGAEGWLLVDCGRAATQRALEAGLDLRSLLAVAITHHHSDHLSDLATLATTRWTAGTASPLTVVAPEGPASSFARRCLDPFDLSSFHAQAAPEAGDRPTIDVRAFEPTSAVGPVHSPGGWTVSSALVDHHPVEPAVGYRVEHAGVGVAVSGDTAACPGMRELAAGVDVLVHEALLSGSVSSSLLAWNASARSVGELAAAARPRTVVLTHFIPAPRSVADERRFADEVRAGGYTGRVVVAHDRLRVPASSPSRPGDAG